MQRTADQITNRTSGAVFVISANPLVEANSGLGDVECVIRKCTSLVLYPFIGIIALTYHYNG